MIQLLAIIVLIIIAVQDFRSRLIHWWLFPLLAIALLAGSVMEMGWDGILPEVLFSLIYLAVLAIGISGYFLIKTGKLKSVIKNQVGWGDILLLIAIAAGMTFQAYILWVIAATLLGCMVGIVMKLVKRTDIPWAGLMAVFMVTIMVAETITGYNIVHFEISAVW